MNDRSPTSVSMRDSVVFVSLWTILLCVGAVTASQTPAAFDLATLPRLKVTATCGENTSAGTSCEPNNSFSKVPCSACDSLTEMRDLLMSDNGVGWRSVTGSELGAAKDVNITIELGQALVVEHIRVTSASSPLPAIWVLERLAGGDTNFEPWRYYVTSPDDCVTVFGLQPNSGSDFPACTVRKEKIYAEELRESALVTAIRLRLLRPREDWGAADSSELDFYSLSNVFLEGRCLCNGHARQCNLSHEGIMQCACADHTCGVNCESCCHGYQKTAENTCHAADGVANVTLTTVATSTEGTAPGTRETSTWRTGEERATTGRNRVEESSAATTEATAAVMTATEGTAPGTRETSTGMIGEERATTGRNRVEESSAATTEATAAVMTATEGTAPGTRETSTGRTGEERATTGRNRVEESSAATTEVTAAVMTATEGTAPGTRETSTGMIGEERATTGRNRVEESAAATTAATAEVMTATEGTAPGTRETSTGMIGEERATTGRNRVEESAATTDGTKTTTTVTEEEQVTSSTADGDMTTASNQRLSAARGTATVDAVLLVSTEPAVVDEETTAATSGETERSGTAVDEMTTVPPAVARTRESGEKDGGTTMPNIAVSSGKAVEPEETTAAGTVMQTGLTTLPATEDGAVAETDATGVPIADGETATTGEIKVASREAAQVETTAAMNGTTAPLLMETDENVAVTDEVTAAVAVDVETTERATTSTTTDNPVRGVTTTTTTTSSAATGTLTANETTSVTAAVATTAPTGAQDGMVLSTETADSTTMSSSTAATTAMDETSSTTAMDETSSTTTAIDETSTSTTTATAMDETSTSTTTAMDETSSTTTAIDETSTSTTAINETSSTTAAMDETSSTTTSMDETSTSTTAINETSSTAAIDETSSTTTAIDETLSTTTAMDETSTSTTAIDETSSTTTSMDETSSTTTAMDEPSSTTTAINETSSSTGSVPTTAPTESNETEVSTEKADETVTTTTSSSTTTTNETSSSTGSVPTTAPTESSAAEVSTEKVDETVTTTTTSSSSTTTNETSSSTGSVPTTAPTESSATEVSTEKVDETVTTTTTSSSSTTTNETSSSTGSVPRTAPTESNETEVSTEKADETATTTTTTNETSSSTVSALTTAPTESSATEVSTETAEETVTTTTPSSSTAATTITNETSTSTTATNEMSSSTESVATTAPTESNETEVPTETAEETVTTTTTSSSTAATTITNETSTSTTAIDETSSTTTAIDETSSSTGSVPKTAPTESNETEVFTEKADETVTTTTPLSTAATTITNETSTSTAAIDETSTSITEMDETSSTTTITNETSTSTTAMDETSSSTGSVATTAPTESNETEVSTKTTEETVTTTTLSSTASLSATTASINEMASSFAAVPTTAPTESNETERSTETAEERTETTAPTTMREQTTGEMPTTATDKADETETPLTTTSTEMTGVETTREEEMTVATAAPNVTTMTTGETTVPPSVSDTDETTTHVTSAVAQTTEKYETMHTTETPGTTEAATTVVATLPSTTATAVITETSEAEFRKYYGNLPEGVCYCNTFASRNRKCFPPAIGQPCECLPNYGGDRCSHCSRGYYLFAFCFPCRCNVHGSTSLECSPDSGQCPCKAGMRGRKCDSCPEGFFNFPKCEPCECNPDGSYGDACDPVTGQCACRLGIRGQRCEQCPRGYFEFPRCLYCGCNPLSTTPDICDDDGHCLCKENYEGFLCGVCRQGFYDFPFCSPCPCSPGAGSCNAWGVCECLPGFTGKKCDRCKDGYHGFPKCRACGCNSAGASTHICDKSTGSCTCKENIQGIKCDRCAPGLLFFPSCVSCDCNPGGVRPLSSVSCGHGGQCICKANVVGPSCDRCRYGYQNLSADNPSGCTSCSCSRSGTVAGTIGCSAPKGRCDCKSHVTGVKCDRCKEGFHFLRPHDLFGCKACKCHPGGSATSFCNQTTGSCQCRPNVRGKRCSSIDTSKPLYVPMLFHISVELETAVTGNGSRVLAVADSDAFPSFSGDGYMTPPADRAFSVSVDIPRTSSYRLIFHYAHSGVDVDTVRIDLTREGSRVPAHRLKASFGPDRSPREGTRTRFKTVKESRRESEVALDKGRWTATMRSRNSTLLLDYLVFLPAQYYKAEVLLGFDLEPCVAQASQADYCFMYTYYEPSGTSAVTVDGYSGYAKEGDPSFGRLMPFRDSRLSSQGVNLGRMVLLGRRQPTLFLKVSARTSGPHVLVLKYLHLERAIERVYVSVGIQRGSTAILPCKFAFACRQLVLNDERGPKAFQLTANPEGNVVQLETSSSAKLALISITAIPERDWTPDWIRPSLLCRWHGSSCSSSSYWTPRTAVKLDNTVVLDRYTGHVKQGGKFVVIIQYRQPGAVSASGEVTFTSGGPAGTWTVTFPFCSNLGGCRLVVGEDKKQNFQLEEGRLVLKLSHATKTKVEFALFVPMEDFSATLTKPQANERVSSFLEKCAKEDFNIRPTATPSCREDVFALTSEFNNGPLACRCDRRGALSIFCEPFGGQCSCRPFIVGRACHKCRPGYSGFPYCRRCNCSPRGATSQYCDRRGRCKCKPGFGGPKCTRCASSRYYGYPKCEPCGCHGIGSLSTFCRQRDGQCQCRRNFQGVKCDECRIGFFNFPECEQCNCNPAGIKRLAGQGDCDATNGRSCTCKDNVQGLECDDCKDLYYNLQYYNPLGCSPCTCHEAGTAGKLKSCDKVSGQCACKPHVTGENCDRCENGYYQLDDWNTFGCQRCACDVGGSYGTTCDDVTGKCVCSRGVGGNECDRPISREFYHADLHHIKFELEEGSTPSDKPVALSHIEELFPGYSWRGYVILSQFQKAVQMLVDIPLMSRYRLIFHYNLKHNAKVSAVVRFLPTVESATFVSGFATEQRATISFRPTASSLYAVPELMTAADSAGNPLEFPLSHGKWKLMIRLDSGHQFANLFLDYLVLLPEAYYRPTTLKQHVSNACEMGSADEFCLDYTYPRMRSAGFVSFEAEDGELFGPRVRYPHQPFRGTVLTGPQNVLTITLPSGAEGSFALVATYFRSQFNSGPLTLVMRSRSRDQRSTIHLLSCRFSFACRQVAVDGQGKVRVFTPEKARTTFSMSTRHAAVIDSITLIPENRWNAELILPAERCVKRGRACVESSFYTPPGSVVFRPKNGSRHHRQPTYLLDRRMILHYVNVDQSSLYWTGSVPSGRYVIIAHFFQPSHLSFTGKAIISGRTSTAALLRLRYCPHVTGCRALGMSQQRAGAVQYVYIRQESDVLLTFIIPKEKSVWLNHVMLVPSRSWTTSALLKTEPRDLSQDFLHECGQHNFFIKPSASAFCLKSVFSLTTRLHNGALSCGCDSLGSTRRTCESFGGQCHCRPNVIGRICNRCKTGYTGFPNCVRRFER